MVNNTTMKPIMYNMELDIPKSKCYLVCEEVYYEPHNFQHAKVFLNRLDAESYVKEILSKEYWDYTNPDGRYGYQEIIELDLLVKH